MQKDKMRILDIGCGENKVRIKGSKVDGMDVLKTKDVDIVCNIEKEKWPINDNTYDVIYARHILEHIEDLPHVLREIIRVGKNHCIVKINVPHFTNNGSYRDPTHKRFFAYRTFDHFAKEQKTSIMTRRLPTYFSDINFKIKKKRLMTHEPLGFLNPLINLFPNFYERYLAFIFPLSQIYFELEIVK
jgi:2-polyprenyl-3-methyl-5-hydroxy-6-metoxy-1,4-benzoquinol methylase